MALHDGIIFWSSWDLQTGSPADPFEQALLSRDLSLGTGDRNAPDIDGCFLRQYTREGSGSGSSGSSNFVE